MSPSFHLSPISPSINDLAITPPSTTSFPLSSALSPSSSSLSFSPNAVIGTNRMNNSARNIHRISVTSPNGAIGANNPNPTSCTNGLPIPMQGGAAGHDGVGAVNVGNGIGSGGLNARRPNLPVGMRLNINRTTSAPDANHSTGLKLNIPNPASSSASSPGPASTSLASPFSSFSNGISLTHGLLSSAQTPCQSPLSPHTPLPGTPLSYPGFGSFVAAGGMGSQSGSYSSGSASGPSSAGTGSSPWAGQGFGFGFSPARSIGGACSPGVAYGAGNSYGLGAMTPLPVPERRGSAGGSFDFGFGASFGSVNSSGGFASKNKTLGMAMGRARSKSGGYPHTAHIAGSGSVTSTPAAYPKHGDNSNVSAQSETEALETPTAGLFGSIATMTIGGGVASVNENGKRLRDLEEDGEKEKEWVAEEEEILSSFLMNPLRPLTVPYPPSTLPPPRALDELTSQILHFHTPEESSSKSSLSRTASVNTHRRTRSTAGLVWKHTWLSTRKKLFDVARKESMGLEKEDRWKGRVVERSRAGSNEIEIPFPMTPMESLMPIPGLENVAEIENMPPAISRKPGHRRELSASSRMMATLGSGSISSNVTPKSDTTTTGFDFPPMIAGPIMEQNEDADAHMGSFAATRSADIDHPVELLAPRKGLGQVLRSSTSLQRSSKANSSGSNGLMTSMVAPPRGASTQVRPSSLLQRGRSFTATDFESLSLECCDKGNDSMEIEVELDSSSQCSSETQGFTTPRKPSPGSDVFSTSSPSFGSSLMDSPSPSGSGFTDVGEDSLDEEDPLVTPHSKLSPPCIMLTHSSPSPSKDRSNTPVQRDGPGSPSPASKTLDLMANAPNGLRRPKPPTLMRSLSTNSGNTTSQPSAFARFMGTAPKDTRPESAFAAWRSSSETHLTTTAIGFNLPVSSSAGESTNKQDPFAVPAAKRQKGPMGLSVILPPRNGLGMGSDLKDGGLRSPFVEDGGRNF